MARSITPSDPTPDTDQLELQLFAEFTLGPESLSRSIPLWDTLPVFIRSNANQVPADTPASQIEPLCNTFPYRGEELTVEVRPAIIRGKRGATTKIFFPGVREYWVSAAVRTLAVSRCAGLSFAQNGSSKHVTVALTVRQIRAWLEAHQHTYSHTEVAEALDILAKTSITFTRSRTGSERPVSDNFTFYARTLVQDDKLVIFLNPVESHQIAIGAYRAIRADRIHGISDVLVAWFFQHLYNEHRGASKPLHPEDLPAPFRITLEEIFQQGVIPRAKETRKSIARVRKALTRLAAAGVLHVTTTVPGYREEPVKRATGGRSRVVDVAWFIYLSERSVSDIIDANAEAKLRPAEEPNRYAYLGPDRLTRNIEARDALIKKAPSPRGGRFQGEKR